MSDSPNPWNEPRKRPPDAEDSFMQGLGKLITFLFKAIGTCLLMGKHP